MKRAFVVFENEGTRKDVYPLIFALLRCEGINAIDFYTSKTLYEMVDNIGVSWPFKDIVMGGHPFVAMCAYKFQIISGCGWNFIIENVN